MQRFARAPVPIVALLLLFSACVAAGEQGAVVEVVDGDTLKVSLPVGVRTVRLLGVDTPEPGRRGQVAEYFAAEATAFTRGLVEGRSVRLETDPQGDTVDGYGRQLRYVYLPDGRMLNAAILAEGYGHAYTRFPYSRLEEFRRLEREARRAGRGLWSPDALPRYSAAEAREHVGATAIVCGTVASTRYAASVKGRPTFLNLGRPYPDPLFTIVIWGADRHRFDHPETRYADRPLCVTGKIETHRGTPQIVIDDPSQLAAP